MAYIGAEPSNNFVSLKRQVITGNGGTSYTLDHSVASVNDVAIFVNNVRQDPATYSISGTALTLGGTISSSDSCYVIFLGQALQTVTPATGTVTNAMIASDAGIATSKLGTGAILQVQSTTKTDTFDTTSTSFTDVTGLSVAITPSSTSSKVLINFSIGTHDLTGAGDFAYQIVRGSTAIGLGSGGGTSATVGGTINADRGESVAMTFLDSPSTTSATTYKIQVRTPSGTQMFINTRDGNSNYSTISTITVMEIGG